MQNNSVYRKVCISALAALMFICCGTLHAQDGGSNPQSGQQQPDSKMARKALEKQKEQEQEQKRGEAEMVKQHMQDQTPAVRKRMKKDAHKANLNNEHKREFFLKRWFQKKKPT